MAKVLIVYDSLTGNTEKMAKAVEQGAREAGANVRLKKANEAEISDLEWADGIIIGSPTHFGTMSQKTNALITRSAKIMNKLENKVGATFTSSLCTSTGAEITLLSLITAMIQHEMVIVGAPRLEPEWPGRYGATADGLMAVGSPDGKALDNCKRLGKRVADVAKRLA